MFVFVHGILHIDHFDKFTFFSVPESLKKARSFRKTNNDDHEMQNKVYGLEMQFMR